MSRSDAGPKLRGEAIYGMDLRADGMLHGVLVLAPVACGRLRRLDLTEARRMPGVVAVVGAEEAAQLLPAGAGDAQRPVFPSTEILYRNQPVAAVAAETLAQARAAARRVRVDVEPDTPVLDIESIFPEWPGPEAADSPAVTAHVRARWGDVGGAFRSADVAVSEVYRTSGVHQVAMEPHACLARVEGGRWHVTTSTQTPFGVREDAASVLGIPEDRIVVEGTWVGGGFGGKGSSFLEPAALVLAAAAGRPVKLALTHREEFLLGRTTLPTIIRIESAVKDRRIVARRVRLLLDTGASLPGRDFATGYVIGFLLGPYRLAAFDMEGYAVRTHKPPFGPHRAPLTPQCVFALESHMDSIARRIGADPITLRLDHVWREGDTTHLGQKVGPFGLAEGLERARQRAADWRRDGGPGRGIGVACGFWSTGTGAGGEAALKLTPTDLEILEGDREIGSGSVVLGLAEVAARVTGLPRDAIRVAYGDTATAPFDSGVFGSRTVGALGQAVEKASRLLLRRLAERMAAGTDVRLAVAGGLLQVTAGERSVPVTSLFTPEERSQGGLSVGGRHFGAPGSLDASRVVTGDFYPYNDYTGSVTLTEVQVDPATGAVTPMRVAAFPDVGVVLDAGAVTGQVEGAVAMGLGQALTEEMLWGPDGRLANPHFLDYRIPTLSEVPPIEVDPVEGFKGAGPFGAKGVGEPPIIPVPASVANAVADATGARVYELPMTAERVARALKVL
jgi:CO/xanthine dehydrogenase Mo-binding subunit